MALQQPGVDLLAVRDLLGHASVSDNPDLHGRDARPNSTGIKGTEVARSMNERRDDEVELVEELLDQERDPPEPYIDPLDTERALADDLADVLANLRPTPAVEAALARYREARGR